MKLHRIYPCNDLTKNSFNFMIHAEFWFLWQQQEKKPLKGLTWKAYLLHFLRLFESLWSTYVILLLCNRSEHSPLLISNQKTNHVWCAFAIIFDLLELKFVVLPCLTVVWKSFTFYNHYQLWIKSKQDQTILVFMSEY